LHSHEAKRTTNISTDEFGAKVGRIHMDKQDYGKMNVKKMKALRPAAAPATEEEA
jgi:ribosome production factor 2